MKKLFRGLLVAVVAIVLAGLAVPVVQLQIGKRRVAGEIARTGVPRKLSPFGAVKSLSVLPLSDLEAESAALKTEPGVAYLIKADNLNILFDAGRNGGREHPSPVLHNMRALDVDPAVIDMLVACLFTVFTTLHHGGESANWPLTSGRASLLAVSDDWLPCFARIHHHVLRL